MNVISRGIRNAFRNSIRTVSIITILGLSIGLALAMLIARQAVGQKINSINSSVGNTVNISPAGVRGFDGGGNPLTTSQLAPISKLAHVVSVQKSLNDRLTTANTNLVSSINAGTLGRRFAQNGGGFGGNFAGNNLTNFTPPITVIGSTAPTDLTNTPGGGNFTLKSGNAIDGSSTANVAMVGTDLATKNDLSIGSTFTAYNTTITVAGVYDAGNTFSNSELILPLATLQTLSGQTGNVTSAVVTVDSVNNVSSVTSNIKNALGSAADVTNAAEQAQTTIAPLENIKTIALYSLIGAVIAGAIIILLTMIMIVRERRREIGVIKAVGASNIRVMLQFTVEAITLTVIGAIIGIALGVFAGNPITKMLVNNSTSSASSTQTFATASNFTGSQSSQAPNTAANPSFAQRADRGALRGIRNNITNIHAAVGWSVVMYGFIAAIIIAISGSAIAAFFIARVSPAEVMRAE